jgi:hypothetical protein
MELSYLVRRVLSPLPEEFGLKHPFWVQANELEISRFHSRSSDHRPRTRVRALHDSTNLFVRFDVDDRYVISRATDYQDMVCFDSCVEFFFRPKVDRGYFNLEIDCGGTALWHYGEDQGVTDIHLLRRTPLSAEHGRKLKVCLSMGAVVFPERAEPTRWSIGCCIPLSVVAQYVGAMGDTRNWRWDGNFYKCADRCSHPHWASWAPMPERLNFHQPGTFRPILFE